MNTIQIANNSGQPQPRSSKKTIVNTIAFVLLVILLLNS
jgi:hypothetical protein